MQYSESSQSVRAIVALCLLFFQVAGCTHLYSRRQQVQPEEPIVRQDQHAMFPPQSVMRSGDYEGFLERNEKVLKTSKEDEECAVALFNIGFVYSYGKSPCYNLTRGLRYFEILAARYPESSWACQAEAWVSLIKRNIAVESKWRRLREEVKSMQSIVNRLSEQTNPELQRRYLEEIRARDDIIREFMKQIERYRQIDVEIEEKERELLN